MPINRLKEILDEKKIRYVIVSHSTAYTAAAIAAMTHNRARRSQNR